VDVVVDLRLILGEDRLERSVISGLGARNQREILDGKRTTTRHALLVLLRWLQRRGRRKVARGAGEALLARAGSLGGLRHGGRPGESRQRAQLRKLRSLGGSHLVSSLRPVGVRS